MLKMHFRLAMTAKMSRLQVLGLPGLQSQFKASWVKLLRPCLKIKYNNEKWEVDIGWSLETLREALEEGLRAQRG